MEITQHLSEHLRHTYLHGRQGPKFYILED